LEAFNEPHCNYIPKLGCTINELFAAIDAAKENKHG
jgi:hypothetical protein